MSKRVVIGNGLGFGDEGKGTTTHWLCTQHRAHTVIRTGGPQAFHRVVSAGGEEHVHSQFGSGTLMGASTHLSRNMVIEPVGILEEGMALMYEHGIRNIFDYLTVHEDALVITPFHIIANRLRELSRGKDRHSTVGIGVGETVLDAEIYVDETVHARDLASPLLREKLETIRQIKQVELQELLAHISELPEEASTTAQKEAKLLFDERTVDWALAKFNEVASCVRIVGTEFLAKNILGSNGTVVFESSQGILLDRWYGFHPYTTKVRTVPQSALSLLRECNYDGEIIRLGILRAYHTRHGAGPFVSECSKLTAELPDVTNGDHLWAGSFRVGNFDTVAARYAIEVCGGVNTFDGLMITCLDRVYSRGVWNLCAGYTGPDTEEFFSSKDGIITDIHVRHGCDDEQLQRQQSLGQHLNVCSPVSTSFSIPAHMTQGAFALYSAQYLHETLGVPVMAISLGPTEKDKIITPK